MNYIKKYKMTLSIILGIILILVGGFYYYQSKNVEHVIKNGVYKYTVSKYGERQEIPGGLVFGDNGKFVIFDDDSDFNYEVKRADNLKSDLLRTTAKYVADRNSITIKGDDILYFYDLKVEGKNITGKMKYNDESVSVKFK